MADVDMPDAASTGPKAKAPMRGAKAGAGIENGADGKKRFEVKKVLLVAKANGEQRTDGQ